MSAKAGREPNLALARIEQVVETVLDFQFFYSEIHARQVAGFDVIARVVLIEIICRKDFHYDLAAVTVCADEFTVCFVRCLFVIITAAAQSIVLVLRQIKGADVAIGLKIVQLDILGAGVRLTNSRQQRNRQCTEG